MSYRLFIAEKPSMARAISEGLSAVHNAAIAKNGGYLTVGPDRVTWLFGHMYENAPPESYDSSLKSWAIFYEKLPFVPTKWVLEPIESSRQHLKIVLDLVKGAGKLVNAGDAEREGQLLVDELLYEAGVNPFEPKVSRLWISSYAPKDVEAGIRGVFPNSTKENLYSAAVCRQRADWIHGINLTRFFTYKAQLAGGRGVISIGRVQTPTLKIVVDRDREISKFRAVDHYLPAGTFLHANGEFEASYVIPKDLDGLDSEGRLVDRTVASRIMNEVAGKTGVVSSYVKAPKSVSPPLPYSLSALQMDCSNKIGLTAKQTIDVAQALYEKHKVTTYPRTDSRYLPKVILTDQAPGILKALCGYAPVAEAAKGANGSLKSPAWDDAKVSDHHAIIPTSYATPEALAGMSDVEKKVFDLISRAFIAQFYPPYRYETQTADLKIGIHHFRGKGKRPVDEGWRRVFHAAAKDDDDELSNALPVMAQADPVTAKAVTVQAKRTTPPGRFTDATLIDAMLNVHRFVTDPRVKERLKDSKGIGQEATRASIIENLLSRNFLKRDKKFIISTETGQSLIDILPPDIPDPGMTALWEDALERIYKGELTVDQFISRQTETLRKRVDQLRNESIAIKGVVADPLPGDGETCKFCKKGTMKTFLVPDGRFAGRRYLRCSEVRFSDIDACRNIVQPVSEFGRHYEPLPGDGNLCPKCGKGHLRTKVAGKPGDTKKYLSCDRWVKDHPDNCGYVEWADAVKVEALPGDGDACPKCGKGRLKTVMIHAGEHKGKRFLACDQFNKDKPDSCRHSQWPEDKIEPLPGDGDACPQCGKGRLKTVLIRSGGHKGKRFLSCNQNIRDNPASCQYIKWPEVAVEKMPGDGDLCTKCGKGHMRTRVISKGDSKGQRFLSCDQYDAKTKTGCGNAIWPARAAKPDSKSVGKRPGFGPKASEKA